MINMHLNKLIRYNSLIIISSLCGCNIDPTKMISRLIIVIFLLCSYFINEILNFCFIQLLKHVEYLYVYPYIYLMDDEYLWICRWICTLLVLFNENPCKLKSYIMGFWEHKWNPRMIEFCMRKCIEARIIT